MIRSFEVENFLSVKDRQRVDFTVHKSATDPDRHFASTSDKIRLPRVIGIFGANGAGKTSFLRTPRFIADFIVNSASWPTNVEIPVAPFLSKETLNEPSDFTITFDMPLETTTKIGVFEYRLSASKQKVHFESLHYSPGGKNRRLLFTRDHSAATPHLEYGPDFRSDILAAVPTAIINTKGRASLISVLAQFGHEESVALQRAAAVLYTNVTLPGQQVFHPYLAESMVTQVYRGQKRFRELLKDFMCMIDLGIQDIDFGDLSASNFDFAHLDTSLPTFVHENLSRNVTFQEESHGTRALYTLLLPIIAALEEGGIAVLDEFDSDIHPIVIPKLIERFQSKDSNPNDAQLIFCGHNPYTLSCLEKEEVFFAEKSPMGSSTYFGLRDVKGVRRSDRYFIKYLSGVYGGTPNV